MQNKSFYYSLLLCFLIAVPAISREEQSINIALITDKAQDLDKSALISLLEVELSQKDSIRLLERAAIDKILDEQQLSAAGLLDRNTTIKIGKLLRADAFIILSLESQTQDANDLIRVRVSETAHGLRLLDYFEQSDSKNPKESAERIIKKIETVINKINQPDEKLIPVGIVDIHRVQLGEKYKMLERTLPVMLSVRLSLEPQIIMLEREDLKALLDEKLMTEGKDTKFWNSAVLIEGYLQPNNGQLEMHLSLKQSGGDNLKSIVVPVEPNEPSIAIAKASTEITKQLQNTPTTVQWKPELEAKEFYEQGQMLTSHSRQGEAMILFETAHALQPENVFYTGKLFEIEWITRDHSYLSSGFANIGYHFYTDIELAELVSVLVRQIYNSYEKDLININQICKSCGRYLGGISFGGYFVEPMSVSSEQIRFINRENRKIWIKTFDAALQKRQITINFPQINNICASLSWISSDDPNELIVNVEKAFIKYVMPPELGGNIKSANERYQINDQAFRLNPLSSLKRSSFLNETYNDFIKLWEDFLRKQEGVENPTVLFNTYLDLSLMLSSSGSDANEAEYYALKALDILSYELQQHDNQLIFMLKRQVNTMNQCLEEAIVLPVIGHKSDAKMVEIWSGVYEPLIEKKDALTLSIWDPGLRANRVIHSGGSTEPKERWYELLERIAEVLQDDNGHKQSLAALSNIRDYQAKLRSQYPYLFKTQSLKNTNVSILLNQEDWFVPLVLEKSSLSNQIQPEIIQVKHDKNILWVAFLSDADFRPQPLKSIAGSVNVSIAGINMQDRELIAMWQAEVMIPYFYSGIAIPELSGLEIGNDVIYLGVKNVGIVEFRRNQKKTKEYFIDRDNINVTSPPGEFPANLIEYIRNNFENSDGIAFPQERSRIKLPLKKKQESYRKPKVYTDETGLPSVLISSIVMDGNKLWVAYGDMGYESGLGIYEPETGKWESILCSIVKGDSPFSSGHPYQILNMRFIKPDKLIFIFLDRTTGTQDANKWNGLWKFNTTNHKLDHIAANFGFQSPVSQILRDAQEKWLLWPRNNISLIEFDIFTEKITRAEGWNPYAIKYFQPSSSSIQDNILWGKWGKSQIIKIQIGKAIENAEIIDNNILDGEPVYKFVSTPYGLIGIGEGIVGLIETGD